MARACSGGPLRRGFLAAGLGLLLGTTVLAESTQSPPAASAPTPPSAALTMSPALPALLPPGNCSPNPPTRECVDSWVCVDGVWEVEYYSDAGTPCGGLLRCKANGTCDGAGTCSATNLPAGTLCRAPTPTCYGPAVCAGNGSSCPPDQPLFSGTACGTSAAPCASSCNGSGSCSASVPAARGSACPYPAACAQICDGASGTCQPAE